MPIYEFRCVGCEQKFEKLCRMGEKSGVRCPVCGQDATSVFSTFFSRSGSSDGGHSHSHSGGCGCGSCSGGDCSDCK